MQHQAQCAVRTINGVRTETIDIKPRVSANASCCIVFIPGNPGCIEFYSRFLSRLSDLSGARVVGIGLAGHSRRDLTGNRVFTLDEQVEHKFSALRDMMVIPTPASAPPPERLLVCGHSIGAWIGLRVLQELHVRVLDGGKTDTNTNTNTCVSPSLFFLGLAPTVELMAEQAGALRAVVAPPVRPVLVALLTALCALLPRAGVEFVMRSFGGATSETVAVAVDAARRSFFANWLGLGELEFGTVGRITPALNGRAEVSLAPEQKALANFLRQFARHRQISEMSPPAMHRCGGGCASIAAKSGTAASGGAPKTSIGPLRLLYVQNDRWYTTNMIERMQRHLSAAGHGVSGSTSDETARALPSCCRVVDDATVSHDFVSSAAAVERMALEAVSDMFAMRFLRPLPRRRGDECAQAKL